MAAAGGRPSGPMTAREAGSLGMHDVGLACLSPGFQTHDPSMREQLQKSISVRNQQQHIIESRLQKTAKGGGGADSADRGPDSGSAFGSATAGPGGLKTPGPRKRPPPAGLSIVPPSAEQFANERVIQSAPLHQTFTGRHQPPHTRHTAHAPGAGHTPGQSSHTHHSLQTSNRLPPIADVISGEGLGIREAGGPGSGNNNDTGNGTNNNGSARAVRPGFFHSNSASNSSHSNHRPAFPSPGLPPPSSHHSHTPAGRDPHHPPPPPPSREHHGNHPAGPHPLHQRESAHGAGPQASAPPHAARLHQPPRDYRSADEAVADMASGREDLLPKIVHYGGHQPPTPPSPPSGGQHHLQHPSQQQQPSQHHHHVHLHQAPAVAVHGGDRAPPQPSQQPQHHHPHVALTPSKHALAAGGGGLERSQSGARRRGRVEYERDNGSPPLGSGPSPRPRPGPFGEGRDSPDTNRRKKEEFLGLCARAWELFHS